MTKYTTRDMVWAAALQLADRGKFTLTDVLTTADLDESSERTARDVLTTMVELSHLETASFKHESAPHGPGAYERRLWHAPGPIPIRWALGKPDGESADDQETLDTYPTPDEPEQKRTSQLERDGPQ